MVCIQAIIDTFKKNKGGVDEDMINKNLKKINVMYMKGIELRECLGDSEDERNNKLRGFVYQLTNALQANNTSIFMDRIVRLYSSLDKNIPSLFVDVLKDKDDFMNYGYSFVIGLKGEKYKEDKNGK